MVMKGKGEGDRPLLEIIENGLRVIEAHEDKDDVFSSKPLKTFNLLEERRRSVSKMDCGY